MQDYSIQWDPSLPPFAGPGSELPEAGYAVEAMADGTHFGNPQALIEVVKSLLTDGSLAVLEGWDNREAPIRLRLSAPTAIAGPALAEAEKALMLAVTARSKAPLVYIPPAQDAVTCVFDVVAAKLERDVSEDWDLEEVRREYRYYLLTLTCLPFARTEESVVVPALAPPPITPTTVIIDDGSSLTNWTASGALTGPPPTSGDTTASHAMLTRTGAVALGATPYLKVTVNATYNGVASSPSFSIDGDIAAGTIIAQSGNVYYLEPGADFTTLRVLAVPTATWNPFPPSTVQVTEVARTNVLPVSGTTRQQTRTATVQGSAPTQAAIRLFDATPADLGVDVLVYTTTNTNLSPALRPWRVSSAAVTADAAMVSGGRNTLTSSMVFEIPAAKFTEGTYALMGRLNVTTGGDLTWSARMVNAAGATTLGSAITTSGTVTLGVTTGYEVLNLGSLGLPVVAVEADQMVELTLTGTANMTFDEGWLFGLDDGALTWIRDATTDLQWIEIRSPELSATRPSVYGGTGAVGNGAACIDFMCRSFGAHRFEPGLMQVFTVTTTSLVSQSELEFYPRYHSHVEGSAA